MATRVLETTFSPQLLADDNVVILRSRLPDGKQVTAVLGSDIAALEGGLIRLYSRAFADCVTYPDVLLCPFTTVTEETAAPVAETTTTPAAAEGTPELPTATPEAVQPPPPPSSSVGDILLVDDNRTAAPGEESEAEVYRRVLGDMGYVPSVWLTVDNGDPPADILDAYGWVIWSRGGYQGEEAQPETLRDLALFLEKGGRLTISGRTPMLGKSDLPASAVADVTLTDEPAAAGGGPFRHPDPAGTRSAAGHAARGPVGAGHQGRHAPRTGQCEC